MSTARYTALSLAVALSLGCGTAPRNAGNASPALQSVTPSRLFRGRAQAVSVAGNNTSFTDASTVSVSGAGVTVRSASALSTAGLRATLVVDAQASLGARDLTVDTLVGRGALTVDDALVAAPPSVRVVRGEAADVRVTNADLANGLDNGALAIEAGDGVVATALMVSPGSMVVHLAVSPAAATGSHDVRLTLTPGTLGADAGAATPLVTVFTGMLTVDDAPVPTLPVDSALMVTVPASERGSYGSVTGAGGTLLDAVVTVTSAVPEVYLALVDPLRGLSLPVSQGVDNELFTYVPGTGNGLLYLAPVGARPGVDHTFALRVHTDAVHAAAETEPNESSAAATSVTLPLRATATLSSPDDQDWYALDAAAGTLLVRTQAADPTMPVDTVLTLLDATGTELASNDDEDPASSSAASSLRTTVTAGHYFLRVTAGTGALTGTQNYALIAAVRAP